MDRVAVTTVSQNIRGALQLQALASPGFPPQSETAFEGEIFSSTIGVPWARMTLLPQSGRPFDVAAATTAHMGLFQVDVMVPAGFGTGAAEVAGDAVRAVFRAGTTIGIGGDRVIIDYADRAQAQQQPDWIFCPVTVGWHCYSRSN